MLGVAAGELMWDAILASIPPQPVHLASNGQAIPPSILNNASGDYRFSDGVSLKIKKKGKRLFARASDKKPVQSISTDKDSELLMTASGDLTIPGRYPLSIRFDKQTLIVNPGLWQQHGVKQ
jgi:hypothetical protein